MENQMSLTEIYKLSDLELIDTNMQALRLPLIISLAMGLTVKEPSKQAEAWLIGEALDWLEDRHEIVVLSRTTFLPKDRQFLVELRETSQGVNARVAYGENRLQAVLRAVLIVAEANGITVHKQGG